MELFLVWCAFLRSCTFSVGKSVVKTSFFWAIFEVKEKKKKKKRKRKRLKKEEKHENVKKKKKTIAKEVSETNRSWINKNENETVQKRKKIKSTSLMSFEENNNSARKFTSEGIPVTT